MTNHTNGTFAESPTILLDASVVRESESTACSPASTWEAPQSSTYPKPTMGRPLFQCLLVDAGRCFGHHHTTFLGVNPGVELGVLD